MLIFRQLLDPASSTYTYLLGDSEQAVLIDPVFEHEQRDSALLRELGWRLKCCLPSMRSTRAYEPCSTRR
jgi:sulfur dioxygenase